MSAAEYFIDPHCKTKVGQKVSEIPSVGPARKTYFAINNPFQEKESAILYSRGSSGVCDTKTRFTSEFASVLPPKYFPSNSYSVTQGDTTTVYKGATTIADLHACRAASQDKQGTTVNCGILAKAGESSAAAESATTE
jgi:hypothetical protein